MEYAWYYDLVLLYVVYSFLGWVAETVVSAARGRGFVDRGFAAGPFCYVYGFAAVIMAVGFDDLRDNLGYLFLGCTVVATVVEWVAAKTLERLHHRTWWDYSNHRFNIDGYVCLPYSLLWGVLGCLSVLWGNDLLRALFHLMPVWLFRTLAWVLGIMALLDQLGSAALLRHRSTPLEGLNRALERQTRTLYDRIALRIERRIEGAYPHAVEKPAALEPGVSLADVVWLFTIGSLVGDLVETLFCRMTVGVWMSRSSLVWGPFSIVWGAALVMASVLLPRKRGGSERTSSELFVMGTFMGGAYEYICSALGELVFGVIFWDYSKIPFNLGGRINLLYCFFWGFAAVAWVKLCFPHVSRGIEFIRRHTGRWLTVLVGVFMVVNMAVSGLALIRSDARSEGEPPANALDVFLDGHFPDERMARIYPNAKKT